METNSKTRFLDIIILDDDDFYNKLLTRGLKNGTSEISSETNVLLSFISYTKLDDLLDNLRDRYGILFLDYYLDNKHIALDAIKSITNKSPNIDIIIMSQEKSYSTSVEPILYGAQEFIHKDGNLIPNTCSFIERKLKLNSKFNINIA